ncbi:MULTISPECIES: DUF6287 domain-containing protein [Streptococcus]|jgi:hypothetical protein|uniref:DUF6287 domain-containing protein n=2 Tax=Streptococcus sanguinis TaxID=1305 RepID=F0INK5_STRSA|nr:MULTISPECIES: DUF6287 domain-containing protein [Streptococcus]EGD35930.1 hypothetical protein HMPREF9383_1706 [Streptococcus sanguinis SK150]EGJ43726.1 hypothetical protein HMPREF9396_1111 [Streptococcus sanguinis SK1059]EGQ20204.1 hypothetical protein HMPREF8573_1101 [Streptococcus sanguinis ATCC 29667]EGQ23449.1 hypothetical protein HMPREF9387_1654 [Streptococcus sanguinis SK340]MCY7015215.1 DUF6287 domain-containing protein [Streptococcus sanguinis]
MKNAKLMFLATALVSSIILLGACSKQQEKQTSQNSSSSQTVQTSKSDSKSEAKAVQSASQDETNVASVSSEAQPKNETKSDTKAPATPATSIDVNALAAGDFSTVAGTWQNDLGDVIVLNNQGVVSHTLNGKESSDYTLLKGQVSDGSYVSTLAYTAGSSSATFLVIPEGAVLPDIGNENPKAQIRVGQDAITASQHPYYRVAD